MYEDLFKTGGLSFERLFALVRLSETGSLIAAADGDPGVQSRYSHHLRELSSYFGTQLTVRAGKTVRLTHEGELLVKMVRGHFRDLEEFRREARGQPQHFQVGAGDSLLQWLFIPALGTMRRLDPPVRFHLNNLRSREVVLSLQEQRLDLGLLRSEAVPQGLKTEKICLVKHAVFVPERLAPARGLLTLKKALLDCPHAALGSDITMSVALNELAQELGGRFQPSLFCDSLSQCIAAVKTGTYAAVLPLRSWEPEAELRCTVVEDVALSKLDQDVVLAWHPRLIEVREGKAEKVKDALASALRARGETGE